MKKLFTPTFYKFFFSFLAILALSFSVIVGVGLFTKDPSAQSAAHLPAESDAQK